ncbi:hypothetical protein [uncultured Sphingomonas sp.]|uniref:hypothetical protein n=1 Tax=uncultured Sphingomonas sp. TaxID=158754 RepID=UPI0025D894BD|nr:hypothetical protein [uncultured Sphingomonas sp.]
MTTTIKLAERVLASARVVDAHMPPDFANFSPLYLLLELYLAEEQANYLTIDAVRQRGPASASTLKRWISAIEGEGLVEQNAGLLALTQKGYTLVVDTLEGIFDVQRELD